MAFVLGTFVGFLSAYFFLPFLINLFQNAGTTRPNYRDEEIPVGIGIIFIFIYFVTAIVLFKWYSGTLFMNFLLGIVIFGLLGLVDDLLGNRVSRGLRGHFSFLLRGKLTTGALKALGGSMGALVIAQFSLSGRPWWEIITSAVLMALAANTLNLLDLRPGRAIKFFLVWFIALLSVGWGPGTHFLFPLVGGLIAYSPYDLKARVMLGDTGANLLGISLGMVTVWNLSFLPQLIVVFFLLCLHLITEKYSLSEIIEKNCFLRFLDRLGRTDV